MLLIRVVIEALFTSARSSPIHTLLGRPITFLMKSVNRSLEFLRRVSRRRSSAQRSRTSISEYIEQGAALLTPEDLDCLQTDLPLLNRQLAAIEAPQFPHLQQQIKLLADFFQDTAAGGAFPAGSEASRKEAAFALGFA